jgi:hypothetical protein
MNTYRWRLSRPAWIAGAAAVACALYAGVWALGWTADVDGTCWAFGRISIVLAAAAAAPLRDRAAPVLDATPYDRRLRRLAPPACAVLALGLVWVALAAVQALRVPGVPWGGLAIQAVAMAAVACGAGAPFARRADPGLVGAAALTLVVLIDETTGIGPWLTAWPGPRWDAGRAAWAALAVLAAAVLVAGLRDPARAPYSRTALR